VRRHRDRKKLRVRRKSIPPYPCFPGRLLHEHHLLDGDEFAGSESVEIHAGGVRRSIERHAMFARFLFTLKYRRNSLTENIKDLQRYDARRLDFVIDCCRRVERVWIVLIQAIRRRKIGHLDCGRDMVGIIPGVEKVRIDAAELRRDGGRRVLVIDVFDVIVPEAAFVVASVDAELEFLPNRRRCLRQDRSSRFRTV
jgi:hypothetical protein